MMPQFKFNTLAYIKTLTQAGINEQQAKAHAKAQQQVFNEFIESQVSSQAVKQALNDKLNGMVTRITHELYKTGGIGIFLIFCLELLLHFLPVR